MTVELPLTNLELLWLSPMVKYLDLARFIVLVHYNGETWRSARAVS